MESRVDNWLIALFPQKKWWFHKKSHVLDFSCASHLFQFSIRHRKCTVISWFRPLWSINVCLHDTGTNWGQHNHRHARIISCYASHFLFRKCCSRGHYYGCRSFSLSQIHISVALKKVTSASRHRNDWDAWNTDGWKRCSRSLSVDHGEERTHLPPPNAWNVSVDCCLRSSTSQKNPKWRGRETSIVPPHLRRNQWCRQYLQCTYPQPLISVSKKGDGSKLFNGKHRTFFT